MIIGGGLTGLEAARILRENRIKTLILEGRNRTGGRIWSIKSPNGYAIDIGAGWIHGNHGGVPNGLLSNPLWDLTEKANLPTREADHDDYETFYPINDTKSDIKTWFNEYIEFVRDEIRITSLTNISMGYYANLFVQKKHLNAKEKYAFYTCLNYEIESNEGAHINDISAKLYLDLTSVFYGEEYIFHETGFQKLTDYLEKSAGNILFNKIVKQINLNNQSIEVITTTDEIYYAEYLLLTVPLGVLKRKQIKFNPALPQWKLDAIDRIGYNFFEKVILIWDNAWWNTSNFYFLRISSKSNQYSYWVNANKWNDKPAIICFFTEKKIFVNISSSDIIQNILNSLKDMFPSIVIPQPVYTYVTNWNDDPFSFGSYSYISINQKYDDAISLAHPIQNRLLFAGEATNMDSYGYAHGALISARREVNRLLYVYHLLYTNNTIDSKTVIIYPIKILIFISYIFVQFSSK